MNTADFESKSLPEQLRAASANEALWEAESDAIDLAADALESLRAKCDELMDLCHRYANQATNAETERDEALQMLADAPHTQNCETRRGEDKPCVCWKAGL